MDLFELAARITLDSSGYEKGIQSSVNKSDEMSDTMKTLQTQYNQAESNIRVLQKALDDYTAETGDASGAGEELAAMLADEQLKAEDLRNSMDALAEDEEEAGDEAEETGEKGKSMGEKLAAAAKVAAAAFAAVTAAATAVGAVVGKMITDTAAYGDNVDKMSQKMGISANAYQEWDAVMQHAGTSMETLKAGMKTLATAAENGNEAFARLGISQADIASMNNEELFSATISALQNVSDETERTYLTSQLLGRGATELGPLLNMSAEETEALKQRVHELGGVMSDDAVKASATFQDNLQDLTTSFDGIKRNIASEFLPGVNDILGGFTSLIIGEDGAEEAINKGLESITQAFVRLPEQIDGILSNISAVLPSVISSVGSALSSAVPQLITSAISIISTNLPSLLKAAVSIVKELGKALTSNIDIIIEAVFEIIDVLVETLGDPDGLVGLIDAAFEIISKLATSLGEQLPVLLPAIMQIIMDIVEKLSSPDNISMLVEAAIALLMGLANGLISSIGVLLDRAPQIVINLMNAIIDNAPKLLEAAAELLDTLWDGLKNVGQKMLEIGDKIVQGIWNGISNGYEWIKQKIEGWVGNITNFFKSILGIHSPSKWAQNVIGKNIVLGMAEGLDDNADAVYDSINDLVDGASDAATIGLDGIDPALDVGDASITKKLAIDNPETEANIGAVFSLLQYYLPLLTNRQIVLDSGATVGALAAQMDDALGRRTILAARGMA